jgi:hypothetical protein
VLGHLDERGAAPVGRRARMSWTDYSVTSSRTMSEEGAT